MPDYKETIKNILSENIFYKRGHNEKMHPKFEEQLAKGQHSLGGKHPVFPEGGLKTFEEEIMGKRFNDVASRYKRVYDLKDINDGDAKRGMKSLMDDTVELEKTHTKKLEKLAIDIVRKEFNIDEDAIDFYAEISPEITLVGPLKNDKPIKMEIEFKHNAEMENAKAEVYKRRFINAIIHGAPKKIISMINDIDEELTDIDPRLPNKYAKIIATADYLSHVVPSLSNMVKGGEVSIKLPNKNNDKAVISAQGKVFPVLVHELVKGVMELISANGLPKSRRIGKYVINNADFKNAEEWDSKLGPALWERFTDSIDDDDKKYKHYIYNELISLPVKEFNIKMREIMGKTKLSKKIVKDLVDKIKTDLSADTFNEALASSKPEAGYAYEDLNLAEDGEKGWNYEEIFK